MNEPGKNTRKEKKIKTSVKHNYCLCIENVGNETTDPEDRNPYKEEYGTLYITHS